MAIKNNKKKPESKQKNTNNKINKIENKIKKN